MFSQPTRLLENGDLNVAERAARFVVLLDEARQLDRAGETRRSAADEHNVHRNRFRIGGVADDQSVRRERRLVLDRKNSPPRVTSHQWPFFASAIAAVSAGTTSNTSPTIP